MFYMFHAKNAESAKFLAQHTTLALEGSQASLRQESAEEKGERRKEKGERRKVKGERGKEKGETDYMRVQRYTARASWRRRMVGRPYLNLRCMVLWCQTFMPSHAPMLPPTRARRSRVASGMRQRSFLALSLSIPYTMNATALIMRR